MYHNIMSFLQLHHLHQTTTTYIIIYFEYFFQYNIISFHIKSLAEWSINNICNIYKTLRLYSLMKYIGIQYINPKPYIDITAIPTI